jgi:demethylmenaquinone methyltransferase/2-methoxy-6-polyprenyl-1,4-benzoquinol methylase
MNQGSRHLAISKSESWRIFNDISPRYDLVNRLLSLGLDIHWRRSLIQYIPKEKDLAVLDVATGTGDVLLTIAKQCPRLTMGVGIDLAERMMAIGREKIQKSGYSQLLSLEIGDANEIPFESERFDLVTMSFGIRNMEAPQRVMREICRVLKSDGLALILEFSLPEKRLLRTMYTFYLRTVVPLMGGLISGHYKAYRYLNQTIESFPYGEAFCRWLKESGFCVIRCHKLLFGVATIYEASKVN